MSNPMFQMGRDSVVYESRDGGRTWAALPDTSRAEFGKYGLPKIDEVTIDLLVGAIARIADGASGEDRERLGHAFAAYLIRAITPRDQIWRDLPCDSDRNPEGEDREDGLRAKHESAGLEEASPSPVGGGVGEEEDGQE